MSGRVESSWTISQGRFELQVLVPPNTTATVWIPFAEAGSITEGKVPATKAAGVRFLKSEKGASVFEVGSGRYRFGAPWITK